LRVLWVLLLQHNSSSKQLRVLLQAQAVRPLVLGDSLRMLGTWVG
jgi:hypothetical protein